MNETSKDEYLNVKLCANEEYEVTDYSIRILQKNLLTKVKKIFINNGI